VAIRNPNSEDAGKYSVEVNGISTSSVLTVIGNVWSKLLFHKKLYCSFSEPESKHEFIKELPESFIGYLSKTAHFVCQTNTCNAKLKWFKNDIQVEHESDERFQVKADLYGNSTFSIKDLVKDDAGNIKCCIDGSQIFTECIFEVKGMCNESNDSNCKRSTLLKTKMFGTAFWVIWDHGITKPPFGLRS